MFLCSFIEELGAKEENDKTRCNFNFGHECIKFFFLIENSQRMDRGVVRLAFSLILNRS